MIYIYIYIYIYLLLKLVLISLLHIFARELPIFDSKLNNFRRLKEPPKIEKSYFHQLFHEHKKSLFSASKMGP
jgi:hypothetical protein